MEINIVNHFLHTRVHVLHGDIPYAYIYVLSFFYTPYVKKEVFFSFVLSHLL